MTKSSLKLVTPESINSPEFTISKKAKKDPRPKFNEALKHLQALGIQPTIYSEFHLKINWVNYYPTTGKIYIDGSEGSYEQKGLLNLEQVLRNENILK